MYWKSVSMGARSQALAPTVTVVQATVVVRVTWVGEMYAVMFDTPEAPTTSVSRRVEPTSCGLKTPAPAVAVIPVQIAALERVSGGVVYWSWRRARRTFHGCWRM